MMEVFAAMLRILAVLVVLLGSVPARAQSGGSGPADAAAIRDVIARQLEAFRHDDAAGAFAFASPGIQAKFGTPEQFMAMVQNGYRPVYRPRDSRFGKLVMDREGPVQHVFLVGPDGRQVLALYSMEREANGSWRISGCVLVTTAAEGV
jgi:hypothetical protein